MQKDTFLGENHTFPSIKAKPPPASPRGGEKPFDEKKHNRNSETQKLK